MVKIFSHTLEGLVHCEFDPQLEIAMHLVEITGHVGCTLCRRCGLSVAGTKRRIEVSLREVRLSGGRAPKRFCTERTPERRSGRF